MKKITLPTIEIGMVIFLFILIGSNLIIEITSIRVFVTFFFSVFIAVFITNKIAPCLA